MLVHVYDGPLTTSEISALLDQAPGPPVVTLTVSGHQVPAALLVWGRPPEVGWVGGVAYLRRTWHSRALVTMWVPAGALVPRAHTDYRQVPRVRLPGDRGRWPTLPPRYPGAGPAWVTAHQHLDYPGLL